MDNRIKQFFNDNKTKTNTWFEIIHSHNNYSFSEKHYNQNQFFELTLNTAKTLAEIMELVFKNVNFKDEFKCDEFRQDLYGPTLIINSVKTKTVYYFGVDDKGIFLYTDLRHSQNLRFMDDTFWLSFLSLSEFGQFELVENEFFGKNITNKYPELFNNKGTMFRIFRNYFIGTIENGKDIILGNLQVSWTLDNDFDKIISNIYLTFKTLYKLNYLLWKIYNVKINKK